MATLLSSSLHYIPEARRLKREEKDAEENEAKEDEEGEENENENENEQEEEEEDDGFFGMHVVVLAKPFFGVMVPRIAHEGICEPREFEIFLLSPTFQYCSQLGFTQGCSNELCIRVLLRVNRFVTKFERWGDVSHPELQ